MIQRGRRDELQPKRRYEEILERLDSWAPVSELELERIRREVQALWRHGAIDGAEYHELMSGCLTRLGLLQESMGHADELLRISPDDSLAAHNAGYLRLLRGDFAGAIPLLARAVELAPNDVESLATLSLALTGAGHVVDGDNAFHDAMESATSGHLDVRSAILLAHAAALLDEHPSAVELYARAVALALGTPRGASDAVELIDNAGDFEPSSFPGARAMERSLFLARLARSPSPLSDATGDVDESRDMLEATMTMRHRATTSVTGTPVPAPCSS